MDLINENTKLYFILILAYTLIPEHNNKKDEFIIVSSAKVNNGTLLNNNIKYQTLKF